MKTSAGLAIVYENKILLVHPTNAPWVGSYSIPKGEIENHDEDLLDTAIRETYEEIGVRYDKNAINKNPEKIDYKDKRGRIYKRVWYYVIEIEEPPRSVKLDMNEVDWVGFLDKEEAKKRILPKLMDILTNLK